MPILYLACLFCTHISEMWIQEVRVLRVSVGMCVYVCTFWVYVYLSVLSLVVFLCTHISEMCIQEVRDLGSVYVTLVYVCIFGCTSICLSWFPLHTHFRDVHPRSEGSWVCVCYICVSIYKYIFVCLSNMSGLYFRVLNNVDYLLVTRYSSGDHI